MTALACAILMLGATPSVEVTGPGSANLRLQLLATAAELGSAPEGASVEAKLGAGKKPTVVLRVTNAAPGVPAVYRYRAGASRGLSKGAARWLRLAFSTAAGQPAGTAPAPAAAGDPA